MRTIAELVQIEIIDLERLRFEAIHKIMWNQCLLDYYNARLVALKGVQEESSESIAHKLRKIP